MQLDPDLFGFLFAIFASHACSKVPHIRTLDPFLLLRELASNCPEVFAQWCLLFLHRFRVLLILQEQIKKQYCERITRSQISVKKLKLQKGLLDLITDICCASSSTHPSTPSSFYSSVSSPSSHDSRESESLKPDSASQSPIAQITTYH